MNTLKVNEDIYRGSGWAVAAIVNGVVIDAEYIDHPDTSDVKAAITALEARPTFVAAKAAADAAWSALEAIGNDESDDNYEALDRAFSLAAVRVRGGMMSSTEFCVDFTKRDRAKAGIRNEWF